MWKRCGNPSEPFQVLEHLVQNLTGQQKGIPKGVDETHLNLQKYCSKFVDKNDISGHSAPLHIEPGRAFICSMKCTNQKTAQVRPTINSSRALLFAPLGQTAVYFTENILISNAIQTFTCNPDICFETCAEVLIQGLSFL